MKKTRQFAFYITLLVPIGTVLGIGAGRALDLLVPSTVIGIGLGLVAAWLLQRTTTSDTTG